MYENVKTAVQYFTIKLFRLSFPATFRMTLTAQWLFPFLLLVQELFGFRQESVPCQPLISVCFLSVLRSSRG